MMIRRITVLLIIACGSAFAHTGEPLEPHDLWTAWRFDPGVVIPLLILGVLYARGATPTRGVKPWQAMCFWGGLLTLVIALISPLHPLGEVLFSAHMLQHEVLMLIAAPLLVLSRPLAPLLWGLPFAWRRALGRWSKTQPVQWTWRAITAPAAAWSIHAAVLWLWHAPAFFQATLTSEWIHSAQHISFFASALLFWWSLLYARGAGGYGAGVLYLFTTAVHTSVLGALLTFARTLWYPAYQITAPLWNLSPLEDQQIGGLIMWIPGGLVYLAAGLALFAAWLRESEALAAGRRYAG
jgi:putative membrane protein